MTVVVVVVAAAVVVICCHRWHWCCRDLQLYLPKSGIFHFLFICLFCYDSHASVFSHQNTDILSEHYKYCQQSFISCAIGHSAFLFFFQTMNCPSKTWKSYIFHHIVLSVSCICYLNYMYMSNFPFCVI